MQVNEEKIQEIWKKARIVEGLDEDMFRLDACGAIIMRERYGMVNPLGWVIDHILPISMGGGDDIVNLRPLHYKNALSKSNDYPSYIACVKYNGVENVENVRSLVVNDKVRTKLKVFYAKA